MGQLFHPAANSVARASLLGLVLLVVAASIVVPGLTRSSWATKVGVAREQPVPFSHQHHVAGLGIDCRYCHTSVENSPFAGVPATKVCMTCHSQIWTNAALLQPVRKSWETHTPIVWNRVHDLAGYVYFNHGIHVQKGVGCSSCHGAVQTMPLMYKASSLQMQWCLDCHRNTQRYLRPREQVFNMDWTAPPDQEQRGKELAELYHVLPRRQLESCSTCHR